MDMRQRRTNARQQEQPHTPQAGPHTKYQKQHQKGSTAADMPPPAGGYAPWLIYAIASGACAAFNGVFAKLTTTELTTTLSDTIAGLLRITAYEKIVEFIVRGLFFVLNLTFNGIMWSLFTTALARGKSATQVSIMNTSTNFLVTAFMGMLVFSETLPPLWWAGATLLVAGSVIAGRKDEGEAGKDPVGEGYTAVPGQELEGEVVAKDGEDEADEDVPDLGNLRNE